MVDGGCLKALLAKQKVGSPMFISALFGGTITSQGILNLKPTFKELLGVFPSSQALEMEQEGPTFMSLDNSRNVICD